VKARKKKGRAAVLQRRRVPHRREIEVDEMTLGAVPEKPLRRIAVACEQRRAIIFAWTLRGLSVQRMAALLRVSVPTVIRDLAEIREKNRLVVKQTDFLASVGAALRKFEIAQAIALAECFNTKPGSPARSQAVRAFLEAVHKANELCWAIGLYKGDINEAGVPNYEDLVNKPTEEIEAELAFRTTQVVLRLKAGGRCILRRALGELEKSGETAPKELPE
jgi:hypothetical protein